MPRKLILSVLIPPVALALASAAGAFVLTRLDVAFFPILQSKLGLEGLEPTLLAAVVGFLLGALPRRLKMVEETINEGNIYESEVRYKTNKHDHTHYDAETTSCWKCGRYPDEKKPDDEEEDEDPDDEASDDEDRPPTLEDIRQIVGEELDKRANAIPSNGGGPM